MVGVDAEGAGGRWLEEGPAPRKRVAYDTLVLATGAMHAYFGHDEWAPFALGLKTIEDATTIRRRILMAVRERRAGNRGSGAPGVSAISTVFVIVGAGPTGVELAGTIAELARHTLPPEFRNIDTAGARVVLIEAGPRVLAGYPDGLSDYARRSLEKLGVEVELGRAVSEVTADVVTYGERELPARTVLWAAGVRASPAAEWLGAPADPAGRPAEGR